MHKLASVDLERIDDQEILKLVIISFILTTLIFNLRGILLGEIRSQSLFKG